MKDDTQKTFVVTDGCMWEANKLSGKSVSHSIEVMDLETGQMRYIKSGSKIQFVEGNISVCRNQEDYNKL